MKEADIRERLLAGQTHGGGCPPLQGGLIVIGSHVRKTSRQLELLLEKPNVIAIEFNTHLVMDDGKFAEEIKRVQQCCDSLLEAGKTTVIYTARQRFDLNTGNKELGQVLPGIPVWLTGPESRFPNTPYIIFPGNVGEEGDLRKIVDTLEVEHG
jgi:uncharacterized protein YgbK (DUF1537 family)